MAVVRPLVVPAGAAQPYPSLRRRPRSPAPPVGGGVPLTWRLGTLPAMAVELTSVADDEVVWFDGPTMHHVTGLDPDTSYSFDGVEVRTLPGRGELLCRFATVNDVHFGETVCGLVAGTDIGPVFSSDDGEDPYPVTMNAGAVAEIGALDPAAVVVKGDLTSNGTHEEYQQFLDCYGVFDERLHHVRGNHDSYHHGGYAAWPTQRVDLPGVTLAILDTSRDGQVNGSISPTQAEWLDDLGRDADRPVLVFGHHPVWDPATEARHDDVFGIRPADSELLASVVGRRPSIVGYFAGHTHRNRRITLEATGDVPWVEVACVKDYPGAWAEYRVFDGGILQVHRRIASPAALVWTERTRHMYEGGYAAYALGRLSDRCFLIDT